MSRNDRDTMPVPRQSLEQTVEWWRAQWEAQRKEQEARARQLRRGR